MKTIVINGLLLLALINPAIASASWDGVVDWARRTGMSTPASGVVARVMVRAGERVKEKTVLLQLEQASFRARVKQAEAVQQYARLMREEAERELTRSQELYDRTLLADHDLNLEKMAYAQADAEYRKAAADLQIAEEQLRNSELHAPFDAMILDRRVQPAQTVVNQLRSEPMLVLASATEMLVRFTIQADEIEELVPGKKVDVECGGKRYQGVVESLILDSVAMKAGSSASSYTVEVIFSTDTHLTPGTTASVSLP